MTPLYVAKNAGIVEFLVKHGADVHFRESNRNSTPIHMASIMNRLDVVAALLQHNAEVNARNIDGRTPLDEAYSERTIDGLLEQTIHVLIAAGARRSGLRGMQDGLAYWARVLFDSNSNERRARSMID